MPMMKCSSTQAATSRISAATTVRPSDLGVELFDGELFIYTSLPAGAAEQEEPPLPGRTPEEHRLREAGSAVATTDRYGEEPSLSSQAILASTSSEVLRLARRRPAPRPTLVSW